ncbi:hypothetical protein NITLEN_10326 [Nitrospira lenta]|uniref:Uncharacterized protein n=1 Tax=Nitrospira lenta TaxID=1436998 RepID=A0A330L0I1_9BACT|nr:hypothetical protein NITLEN_10326 [Nitrospira lenta]
MALGETRRGLVIPGLAVVVWCPR